MAAPFHDPLVVPVGDEFLGLSTDLRFQNVTGRLSQDLLTWSEPFSLLAETPAPVLRHVKTNHFWAPELVKRGDTWRLYYCASRPGKTQSVIGLAESQNPRGPFRYVGDVVVSTHSDTFTQANAIDPCVAKDREGHDWLIYGSFFGGIHILPLGEDGFPTEYNEGLCIAGGNHLPVEGAYVHYHAPSDRFVLFTSWGNLAEDYHIRVAYSQEITGPYVDGKGFPMTDLDPIHHPGDKICGGYNFDLPDLPGVMATGHNTLMRHPKDGVLYMVHHARPEGDVRRPFLQIRALLFSEDGRAMAWPLTYDGHPLEQTDVLPPVWRMVYHSRPNRGVVYGRRVTLEQAEAVVEGTSIRMKLFHREWQGCIYRQGDRIACSLISPDGEALWGVAETE